MGIFDFLKSKESQTDNKITSFLNKVDKLYMSAFPLMSVKNIAPYLTEKCLVKLQKLVYSGDNYYFASEKMRDTTWTILNKSETSLSVRKEVTFSKIKLSRDYMVTAADNYTEVWSVDIIGDSYKISDIVRGTV